MKLLKIGRKCGRFDKKSMYLFNISDKSYFFHILLAVNQSFCFSSRKALILQRATRKTYLRTYQCI